MPAFRIDALFVVNILLALSFLAAGGAKLIGVPREHESFAVLALPVWFGYFIGVCQLAGGLGLLVPVVRIPAAAGLATILLGALYYHLKHTPWQQGIPAFVMLLMCVFVAWRASLLAPGQFS